MALANVALTDTFDTWRIRTNQLIAFSNVVNDTITLAYENSNAAFDKANSANVLAYNAGIAGNAYSDAVGASSNARSTVLATAGNNYTNAVGTSGNAYTVLIGTSSNNYALAIGTAGNNYTNAVGTAGNNYAIAVGASSNAWTNTRVSSITGTAEQIFVSTGTTPTINLVNTGVTAATYGGAVNAPVITVDSTGRITSASNVTVGITVANETANTSTFYPLLASVTSGTLTSSNVTTTKLYFVPGQGTLSATAFASLSDINLKENVTTISNALGTIDNIQGVKFTWKDTQIPSYGVIAQNIEQFIPELVDNTNPENKTVNYDGLIAFLIESVKQLSDKINELEKKIT